MKKNNERQKLMSMDDFHKALDFISRIKTLKEVGLFYMGESGIHPQLAEMYKELKDRGYFTYLTTNATYIDTILQAIPYIDSLKVSWNYTGHKDFEEKTGCPESTYHKIRKNITYLYQECHLQGKQLAISTVLDRDKEDYFNSLIMLPRDEHYWIPLQTQGGLNEFGEDGVVGEDEHKVSPFPCWSLFKGIYIDADLMIRACCYGHTEKHIIGRCEKGFYKTQYKMKQLEGKIPEMCKECLRSQA
jgi:MoaA/NifB/PqqE/SkfB family radical SAM enzyme